MRRLVTLPLLIGLLTACWCGFMLPAAALASPPGTISTVAGDPTASGPATRLGQTPGSIAPGPGGVLYLTDPASATIRDVSSTGVETTVVGDGSVGFSGDGGPATNAQLNDPVGVAVDQSGDLVFTDSGNNRVRLVAGSTCSSSCPFGLGSMTKGDIYTIAGNGTQDDSGDGGLGTSAAISQPIGITVDQAGDAIFASGVTYVRLVAASTCSSACPYGLTSMPKGDIYTVAGGSGGGFSGDNGPAIGAGLQILAQNLAVDAQGNLLIPDTNNLVVRMVAEVNCASSCSYGLSSITKGDIYTIAGVPGNSATLYAPQGVTVDPGGDVLIADTQHDQVMLLAASTCSGASCPYGLSSMTKGSLYRRSGTGSEEEAAAWRAVL